MECQNNGPWHLGISAEACENAGGNWFRTPCHTLKEAIDNRPSRFDLTNPVNGSCQDAEQQLVTAFVSANMSHANFTFDHNNPGCLKFCQSLPNHPLQTGMMIKHQGQSAKFDEEATVESCTCVYPNGNLPSNEILPSYATPSPPAFTITNSNGMALGLRPKIDCDSDDDLDIESQLSDPNNPRQQFQSTLDGQIVSVRCPKKVLTAVSGSASCAGIVGLQMLDPQGTSQSSSLRHQWSIKDSGSIVNMGCPNLAISSSKEKSVARNSIYFALQNPRTQLAIGVAEKECRPGVQMEVQELVYGSPNQQFVYNADDRKIVSLMCPEYAIEVPNGNCQSTVKLHLSDDTVDDERDQWTFDSENMIRSVKCSDMFITTSGASGGGAQTIIVPANQLASVTDSDLLSVQGAVSSQGATG